MSTSNQNPSVISPPWTPEQVEALNRWQTAGYVHPFTCGVCRDRDTDAYVAAIEAARAAGEPDPPRPRFGEHALVATADGWVCETCDYTQDWAHEAMLHLYPNPLDPLRQTGAGSPVIETTGTIDPADPADPAEEDFDGTDRTQWPYTTPSGHTYVEPTDYDTLRSRATDWGQAHIESWDPAEHPPPPTWEMLGIALAECDRLTRSQVRVLHLTLPPE